MAGNVLHIDTRDFYAFALALRRAEPLIARELTARLRVLGNIVADEARSISSEYSVQIPDSIKVRVKKAVVTVEAGPCAIAGLFEVGNKGNRSANTFRHPVFGNTSVWVDQPMHPFLHPALANKFAEVEVAMQSALDVAVAEAIL